MSNKKVKECQCVFDLLLLCPKESHCKSKIECKWQHLRLKHRHNHLRANANKRTVTSTKSRLCKQIPLKELAYTCKIVILHITIHTINYFFKFSSHSRALRITSEIISLDLYLVYNTSEYW